MSTETGAGAGTQPRGLLGLFGKKLVGERFRAGLLGRLFAPVDIASLAFFRVAFGVLMYWEISRFFSNGWIGPLYAEPTFRFTYYGFDWLQSWPDQWMNLHFLALPVLALLIAAGYLYRVSTALFFVGFTYLFLLDQANYLNHFYLICLISFLMIFIPAHRAFSVDAWMRPRIRSRTIPAWMLWLLMAQVGIVYFYGGLAKLNGDWLRGEPMRLWLTGRTDFPIIGRFFTEEWMVYLFSYGGLLLDLLVVPFLLWRRTRLAAFAFAISFHLTNVQLFNIGVFPWFMIAATLLFFPPWWPRAVGRLRISDVVSPAAWSRAARRSVRAGDRLRRGPRDENSVPERLGRGRYAILGLLAVYFAVQLFVPLRHHLYPGNVNWTEEGHRFSWHMLLRHKDVHLAFVAVNPETDERWNIYPQEYGLTGEQIKEMSIRPDMILQFAHHAEEEMRRQGRGDVRVRAITSATLNGRARQSLIDPGADLAEEQRMLTHADWIVPLEQPFRFRDHGRQAGVTAPGS